MSGPPPKPPHLELIQGRPGKRRLRHAIQTPISSKPPAPPAYLTGHALAVWSELAGELHKLGLLTPLDVSVFATYCDAVRRWRTACEVLEAMPDGERYTTPPPAERCCGLSAWPPTKCCASVANSVFRR